MTSPRVLVREDSEGRKRRWRPPGPDFGWKLLGLALLLGAAVARGWILGTRVWAIVGIVMAVLILAAAVIWALNLPLAFRSVQEPAARLGLKKSVAKSDRKSTRLNSSHHGI